MKQNSFHVPALILAGLASIIPASAAIDITEVTGAVADAETTATTLGAAALGLAVIFMGYKLVKRAIAKV